MDAAFSSLDFPGLDWGGYAREEVLDLLTEAALDSLDGGGADFAADQPRVPAGSPEGGQFGPGGGGSGGTKAERRKRRAEKEAAVRAKLGPERIATVRQAVTDLLPKYQHVALYGRQVKAFDPAVPENDLVRELDRRGLSGAGGYAHRLLDAMAFIGELAKLTTGAGDPLQPNLMHHAYRLPRPDDAAFAFDPDDFLDSPDGTGADFAGDEPAPPPDPSSFFALAERDGAAAALAAWEEAQFYSPDQPRDDRGRWSSGGGGGNASVPAEHRLDKPEAEKAKRPTREYRQKAIEAVAKAEQEVRDLYDRLKEKSQGVRSSGKHPGDIGTHHRGSIEGLRSSGSPHPTPTVGDVDQHVNDAVRELNRRAAELTDIATRGDPFRGGMRHADRSELRADSAQAVRDFVARGGPATGEEVAALGNHLARLTVAQLHALRAEHGLPAAGAWRMRRPDLVNALAGRFRDHRAALPTRAAKELAAAAAGGAFEGSRYTPGDSTHAVKHGRTGFTVSAHPDGRFHVWDTGLAHEGAHDTAAEAVAHAANPPPKPSPDYQPRTADVETAARQGAVADAAARRAGAGAGVGTVEGAVRHLAATQPGDRPLIAVSDVVRQVPGADRAAVHEALLQMWREGRATLWPVNDPMKVTPEQLHDAIPGNTGERFTHLQLNPPPAITPAPSPAAPGAGGGAGPKAGGFDPNAEARAIHDLVGRHVAEMHAAARQDEGPRGQTFHTKYAGLGEASARAMAAVEAHVDDLVARAPNAAALRDAVRAYGLTAARGSKADVEKQLRDTLRQRLGTVGRVYAAADHEPDPSEAQFRAQRPVRFVPYVQPAAAGGARA